MAPTTSKSGNKVRIGVLVNPLSGKNRQGKGTISQTIEEYPEVLLQKVQTPQDILEALIDFSRREVSLLVISGGDGTVQAVLTVLFQHHPFAAEPQLMVLAGGTTNMIAGDVGVPGNQNKAVQRLLQWLRTDSGRVTRMQRPVLRLQVPGHEVKYGMFFGAATISQGVQYYQKNLHNKRLQGLPGICVTLGRFLWGVIRQHKQCVVPTHIKLSLDKGTPQQEEFLLLFVSTLERLFFGLRPFWGIESGPLRFTAVKSRARYLLRVIPALARGRRTGKGIKENGYYSHNIKEVELYIGDSVALDGEVYTPESAQTPTLVEYGGNITFLRV